LAWDSAGTIGYKGSRKSTPFAAQRAAEKVADKIKKMGVHEIEVLVRGPGSGRESAVRALSNSGIEVKSIEDVTPLPHNGCARASVAASDRRAQLGPTSSRLLGVID
jgi:small subunit ribosomal protein S11